MEEYEIQQCQKTDEKYPLGTVTLYGPNDKTTTKITAKVFLHRHAEPTSNSWVSTHILDHRKVFRQVFGFFTQHSVKYIAIDQGIRGCPHEEGLDFPDGEDCPFCPFWKGKQGSNRKE